MMTPEGMKLRTLDLFSGIGGLNKLKYLEAYLLSMTNRYTYKAPCDEETLFKLYVTENRTQTEVAKILGTSQHVIWRALKKMGIPTRKAAKRNQYREENSNWKGGRVLTQKKATCQGFRDGGYWYVRNPEHPNATKNGYVAEHVLVATNARGYPLQKGECVHHKDFDKSNNNLSNLAICTRREHRIFQLQLEEIAIRLYKKGLVKFDDAKLEYRLLEGIL